MPIEPVSIHAPIKAKIAWAGDCLKAIGDELLADESISLLCRDLLNALRDCRSKMLRVGIVDECRACEETRGGSCCGLGLENYYSGTLLLINLLLGVELPSEKMEPRSCFFLGRQGCLLAVRDVLCINYLCEEITSRFSPQELAVLREREGVQVRLLFELNERILAIMSSTNSVPEGLPIA